MALIIHQCPDCRQQFHHLAGCSIGGNGQPITAKDRQGWTAAAKQQAQTLIAAQVRGNEI